MFDCLPVKYLFINVAILLAETLLKPFLKTAKGIDNV